MKILRRTPKQDDDLRELEDYLEAMLQPVEPRPGFVADLRARLAADPAPKRQWPTALRYTLLAAAGLVSSAIIVVTGIRAAITLLGALGVIRHARSQVQQKPAAAAPPVA